MAEQEGLGDVAPRKRSKSFYIGIAVVSAIAIAAAMMITGGDDPPANGAANPNPSTPITIPQLKSSVDSLNATVTGFAGRLATLETQIAGVVAPTVTQANIDNLQASITTLTNDLATLNAIVANFTGTGTDGGGTVYTGEISRWDFDSLTILGCTHDYTFEVVSKSPSRIEEEDLYEIVVEITNENVVVATGMNVSGIETDPKVITQADIDLATIALNHELEIVISPRDYCMVNDATTYLDSDGYPYLSWDADFVTRTREGQEVCRRITFTTEVYNFGNLLSGESLDLDLVFELYYA